MLAVQAKWSVLENAQRRLDENLAKYGSPASVFGDIATLLGILDFRRGNCFVNADDVAVMMMALKLIRIGHTEADMDSLVDIAGYAACAAAIQGAGTVGCQCCSEECPDDGIVI